MTDSNSFKIVTVLGIMTTFELNGYFYGWIGAIDNGGVERRAYRKFGTSGSWPLTEPEFFEIQENKDYVRKLDWVVAK